MNPKNAVNKAMSIIVKLSRFKNANKRIRGNSTFMIFMLINIFSFILVINSQQAIGQFKTCNPKAA